MNFSQLCLILLCSALYSSFSLAESTTLNEYLQKEQEFLYQTPLLLGQQLDWVEQQLTNQKVSDLTKAHLLEAKTRYYSRLLKTVPDEDITQSKRFFDLSEIGGKLQLNIARNYSNEGMYAESAELLNKLFLRTDVSDQLKAEVAIDLIISNCEQQNLIAVPELIKISEDLLFALRKPHLNAQHNYALGYYYGELGQDSDAIEFYQKAVDIYVSMNDWMGVSDSLYAIGISYRNMDDIAKAIEFFQLVVDNDRKIDIDYSKFYALYGIATTYFRDNMVEQALGAAHDVLVYPNGRDDFKVEIHKWLIRVYLAQDNFDKAKYHLHTARKLFAKMPQLQNTTWAIELLEIEAQLAEKQGNHKLAYEKIQLFHSRFAQIKDLEERQKLKIWNQFYQVEKSKAKSARLEKQNKAFSEMLEAKQAAQRSQLIYNRLLLALTVLISITLIVILIQWRRAKHAGNLLNAAKEEAEQSNRLKSDFIANVSHEIRTPLNAIVGFSQVLVSKLSDNESKKLVRQIGSSSELLLQLINDLLDFSKIEANKLEISETPHQLNLTLRRLGEVFSAQAKISGLKLLFSVDKSIPKALIFDDLRLKQVLSNLISNAIKFSHKGDVVVAARVVDSSEAHCSIELSVTDEGIGLSQQQIEKLFKPFMQAESSTARKYGGSGLGLAISQNILTLMNSVLVVKSEEGKGSRFSFELNLAVTDESNLPNNNPSELITHFNNNRILLAEDNEINAEVIVAMLADTNLIIERAHDGKEAVEFMQQEKFDCVLMDIQMPIMDGYEATRQIRGRLINDTPIIALTANALEQDIEQSKIVGMNKHLSKPVVRTELLQVLNEVLNDNGREE